MAACKSSYGLKKVGNVLSCAKNLAGNKSVGGCNMNLPYMQYCSKCSTNTNRCDSTACSAGRAIDASGLCSLNCKG